jgi:hypothetical protein
MKYVDQFLDVDGLKTRYIEAGSPAAILWHGVSLGSSADVFEKKLGPVADAGVCAIAYDQPGFGRTDNPAAKDAQPTWQRLADLPCPLLLTFGKNARWNAFERAMFTQRKKPATESPNPRQVGCEGPIAPARGGISAPVKSQLCLDRR